VPKAENVILLGRPRPRQNTGRSGSGMKAAHAGYSVLFNTASNWITRLSTAHYANLLAPAEKDPPLAAGLGHGDPQSAFGRWEKGCPTQW